MIQQQKKEKTRNASASICRIINANIVSIAEQCSHQSNFFPILLYKSIFRLNFGANSATSSRLLVFVLESCRDFASFGSMPFCSLGDFSFPVSLRSPRAFQPVAYWLLGYFIAIFAFALRLQGLKYRPTVCKPFCV